MRNLSYYFHGIVGIAAMAAGGFYSAILLAFMGAHPHAPAGFSLALATTLTVFGSGIVVLCFNEKEPPL